MIRVLRFATLFLAISAPPAFANDAAKFISNFSGVWLGTGQLLFGADSGLKFSCELKGDPSAAQLTFSMAGRCWMGSLSAPVHARLRYNGDTNQFYGEFMDGANGDGLDIVGARAGQGFSLQLTRGAAQGRLAAIAVNADQMRITMFYRDRAQNRELPVVAMGFTRKDSGDTLPDYMGEIVTGSIAK